MRSNGAASRSPARALASRRSISRIRIARRGLRSMMDYLRYPSTSRRATSPPSRGQRPLTGGGGGGSPTRQRPPASEVISVCVRVRGLSEREASTGEELAWRLSGDQLWEAESETADGPPVPLWGFSFPRVFSPSASQADVYAHVRPVVQGWLAGLHGTVFAFGQTSAGKTHTMQGPPDDEGIIPRALADAFASIESARASAAPGGFRARLTLSYLELYNEECLDLLEEEGQERELSVRDGGGGPCIVEGLTVVEIRSYAQAAALLAVGDARRHVCATAMNRSSSRSHVLLRLCLEMQHGPAEAWAVRRCSNLSLVDLAGSERARSRTLHEGPPSLWGEGCAINLSLLTLGKVIAALGEGGHCPWRDSKLTRLLCGLLGGNARAAAVLCVSPSSASLAETRQTLRFGERCQLVTQRAVMNEQLGVAAQLYAVREENSRLKQQLLQLQCAHLGPQEAQLLAASEAEAERLREALAVERSRRARLEASLTSTGGGSGSGGGGIGGFASALASTLPPAHSLTLSREGSAYSASAGLVRQLFDDMRSASEALRGVREELQRAGAEVDGIGGGDGTRALPQLLARAAAAAAVADAASISAAAGRDDHLRSVREMAR